MKRARFRPRETTGNKKPRKTVVLRGFSIYFANYIGLRRNNCWCQERTRINVITH